MSWLDRHPDRVSAMRVYAGRFEGVLPAVLRCFTERMGPEPAERGRAAPGFFFPPDSNRGLAVLLLFSSLFQEIEEERLAPLLLHLHGRYGDDLFRLNRLPFAPLQACIDAFDKELDWSLRPKAPGILRSVCDFFLSRGSLRKWLSQNDGPTAVQELAEGIFLMGRTSPQKFKARYFLWLCSVAAGDVLRPPRAPIPIAPGHIRFLKLIGPLKGRKQVPEPQERLEMARNFFPAVFPEAPQKAFLPFDAFLKRKGRTLRCREVMDGCAACALNAYCPGRET